MRAFRFRSSLKKCSVEKLYSRRFAARVLGLRRNTHRPAADETKLPVAREKKPLVPRVVVGVQRWQRNVQKYVMHVQNCCFADIAFRSRCRHRRLCLSSLWCPREAGKMDYCYFVGRPGGSLCGGEGEACFRKVT